MVDYTILNLASAARTTSGDSGALPVGNVLHLAADVNITAVSGSTPSMTLYVDRLGIDGNWYNIWTSAAQTAAGVVSVSIGPGCTVTHVFGTAARLRWAITGGTPSFTFSGSIVGK